jgi:large subunit ribosomal protein L29
LRIKEIRELSNEELVKQLEVAGDELFNLCLRAATRQLANHREIPRIRKEMARIKTVLRERELSIR